MVFSKENSDVFESGKRMVNTLEFLSQLPTLVRVVIFSAAVIAALALVLVVFAVFFGQGRSQHGKQQIPPPEEFAIWAANFGKRSIADLQSGAVNLPKAHDFNTQAFYVYEQVLSDLRSAAQALRSTAHPNLFI